MNVTLFGCSNMCSFTFQDKNIRMDPLPPKSSSKPKSKENHDIKVKESKTKALHIINMKEFKREAKEEVVVFALVIIKAIPDITTECPPEVGPILREFWNMFPADLPDEFPSMHNIQHTIDLVPGEKLSNLPHYRMNLIEHAELKKPINELLRKGFIQESLSLYTMHALLTPKKDGT